MELYIYSRSIQNKQWGYIANSAQVVKVTTLRNMSSTSEGTEYRRPKKITTDSLSTFHLLPGNLKTRVDLRSKFCPSGQSDHFAQYEGELYCLRRVRSKASFPAERGAVDDSRKLQGMWQNIGVYHI